MAQSNKIETINKITLTLLGVILDSEEPRDLSQCVDI